MIKIIEPIKRASLTAVDSKKEMIEATLTRDAVIELQQAVNVLTNTIAAMRVPTPAAETPAPSESKQTKSSFAKRAD